jgi:hypothetical protein
MEIKLNLGRIAEVSAMQSLEKRGTVPASGDNAVFDSTEALRATMKNIPDIREEVVARAKSLAASIDYPPPAALDSLAKLLAMKLQL